MTRMTLARILAVSVAVSISACVSTPRTARDVWINDAAEGSAREREEVRR